MNIQNDSNGLQSIDFKKIWKEAVLNLGHSTIIVTGKTGVGKSTLINAVFSKDVAETGVGKPITNEIKEYSLEDFPISIIDTKGFEIEGFEGIKNQLIDEITRRRNDPDPTKHVNVCWYCINYGSGRIEPAEIEFLKEFSKFVKIIVVITQAYFSNTKFQQQVEDNLYNTDIKIVKLVALENECFKPYGLDKLVEITESLLPEAQKKAFAAAQKVRIDLKIKKAHLVVAGAVASATAAGAVPIPFSDAIVLVPIQVGMLAGISATMGLDFSDGFLKTLIASALGTSTATLAGKAIVSGLFKLIPGFGSVVGGLISGATAASLTTALGEAYIKVLEKMLTNNSAITPEKVAEAMREEWTKK